MKLSLEGSAHRDMFGVPPERLIIIGLDTKDGPEHALYDERVHMPLEPAKIQAAKRWIAHAKVVEVRRNGKDKAGEDLLEVVHGRMTTRYARAANKEIKADGGDPLLVDVKVIGGTDRDLAAAAFVENAIRTEESVQDKAAKALRLVQQHAWSIKDVATMAGVTQTTVKSWLEYFDLDKTVQDKVARGEIKATAALPLAKKPREEQRALVAKIEKAKANGKRPTLREVRAETCKTAPKYAPPSRKQIVALLGSEKIIPAAAREALEWATGERAAPTWASAEKFNATTTGAEQ
jgi:ParB-like chromosome segregation protein Spo0J